ncbi:hypothetical protein SERLA73DRAFT_174205 [Serpula lacrymans var. lacrymans S7.3]|uniref:Pentacotripeptide-repeat region of PRORP domain-containing protein n=2 Tax=Serpula lacrymans var. lacrymans TaxID=341189 RepID=F8PIG1_SERL3|nr:uncharacterized protein SERLADRAFT_455329 [Serpula lacrymans var. lacrymans S7.9]EGO05204.1 hypothetical protein SERLA73DRAFT_174205 [Serpula lacrymans var. lacrymans S7.3]EGO30945.1 hypothetical protein SERLADRAFT_455329 [Serpula lacrymans var. lacrymans S7.9]
MMFHLRRGDPNAVLELHGKYLLSLGTKEVWEEPLAVENKTGKDNGLALGLHTEKIPYNPAKVSILLAVITAHAMSDSFEGALRAFMQSTVRINQVTVKDFLLNIPDAALRRKVEAYIRRLDTARLVSQPSFLSKQISLLAQNQNVARLEKLYSTVIDGLSGSLPYLTLRTDQATSHTLIILEVSWAAFLTAFMQCRRRDLAEKLWDDVIRHGAQPGVIMWTALLDGYDSMGEADDALKAWQTMISQGVKPDALTYRALISTLYNARRSDEAIKYFESYENESSKGLVGSSSDSLSVYNTVLHGLLTNGQDEKAVILLQKMQDKSPKPDIVSYNTLLRYYGRRADFKGVSSILKQLTENGLGGDVFTYSTILSALLKAGRTDATDIVLNIMKRQNVEPNAAVYSAIIDYQVREQTEQGLKGAIELLQKMEENPEAQPNEVTYTSILAGVHRGVWSNEKLAAECRQYILGRMKARSIQPNRVTYHILLQACFDNPESHGLQSALGYYREMVKRKIQMTHDTWYIILYGLVVREEWAVADEIVDDFNKSGLKSIGRLADLVTRVRRRTVKKMRLGPKAYI